MTDYPSNLSMLFVGSFVFTYLVIPVLRQIIIKQDVFNSPTKRDLHKTKIPKLIGIAFYFCIVLCSIFLFQAQSDSRLIVLMTALTTILALCTMVFSDDMGSDMTKPMAIVTIGGLVYGTLLTLIVIPCIYDMFSREKKEMIEGEE